MINLEKNICLILDNYLIFTNDEIFVKYTQSQITTPPPPQSTTRVVMTSSKNKIHSRAARISGDISIART